jgi:general secretion pathway protein F
MPRFRYKALAGDGGTITGELDASSLPAAIEHLQALGHFPISTVEASAGRLRRLLDTDLARLRRPSVNELAIAIHELATLLDAGLPLDRSLEILVDLTPGKSLKPALERVLGRVRDGSGLADALGADARNFPSMAISLIRAGELSGGLENALLGLADYLGKAHALRETIKSALVYPIILLVTGGLSLTIVLTYVLPAFKPLFAEAGKALPISTQIVMAIGDVVTDYGWLMGLSIVAAVLGFRRAMKRPELRRRRDAGLLRLPVLGGLITRIEAARFSRTLGTLLGNGVTLPAALAITSETLRNTAMAAAVAATAESVREGEGLADLLARARLFPSLALHLVRVGEETGKLEAMLLRQADIYDREVQRVIDRLLAALVPALTIGLGAAVATIIASILLAILKINELAA